MGGPAAPDDDPWRAAQARRAERGEPGLTAPRPAETGPPPPPTTAGWYDAGAAAPPRPPTTAADGRPTLPPPGPPPAWLPPPGTTHPGPGMAAPGRYGWGRSGEGYVPSVLDKGARTSLILAIVSLFICGVLLGPAAIVEGVKARRRIRAAMGGLTGDGLALAGIIIGIISTVLALGYLVLIVSQPGSA